MDERKSKRESAHYDVTCRSMGEEARARITNVSADGCSLTTEYAMLVPGNRMRLSIEGFSTIDGMVKWADDRKGGVEFADKLHGAVVAYIASRIESAPGQDGSVREGFVPRDRFGRRLGPQQDRQRLRG